MGRQVCPSPGGVGGAATTRVLDVRATHSHSCRGFTTSRLVLPNPVSSANEGFFLPFPTTTGKSKARWPISTLRSSSPPFTPALEGSLVCCEDFHRSMICCKNRRFSSSVIGSLGVWSRIQTPEDIAEAIPSLSRNLVRPKDDWPAGLRQWSAQRLRGRLAGPDVSDGGEPIRHVLAKSLGDKISCRQPPNITHY